MTAQQTPGPVSVVHDAVPSTDSVFGKVRLGYLVASSKKLPQWQRFLSDAIGLASAEVSEQCLAYRMDAHARRFIVEPGDEEDLRCLGWQVEDADTLDNVLQRLRDKNVPITFDDGSEAARRGVESFHRFVGPKGMLVELFVRPLIETKAPEMLNSGFVTDEAGMGHISLMSREPARSISFWQELFDARISDTIELGSEKRKALDVTFLRFNPRHHSVAIAATRGVGIDMFRTRVQHINLEVKTIDDLSAAFDRCQKQGYKLARNIGQHPNDRELSFYVRTPSGFDLEIGWNALTVDEATWQAGQTYDAMSTWGHDVPGVLGSEMEFQHSVNAVRSLMRKEYFPWQ